MAVRGLEDTELPACVVIAVVRPARQHQEEPELVGRRAEQLFAKQRDDLNAPEELIFEVDQPLRSAQRAQIRFENGEVAIRKRRVRPLRDSANHLHAAGTRWSGDHRFGKRHPG